jgi:hypothetical protein
MTPFPSVWDSSMLATLKACSRKFQLEYVQGWRPQTDNVHLHAGKAFASGIEAARVAFYQDGKAPEEAVALGLGQLLTEYGEFECPEDSPKSASRMAGALEFYFDNYPLGADNCEPITLADGKRGIEINFVEPLPLKHPATGEPLLYCGRLDMAANYAGGLFIVDEKTTSSLGATWSRQWDLRSQFMGYSWGLERCMGQRPAGALVRGVSILKTKYETQQAIIYHPPFRIEQWYLTTLRTIERAIGFWKEFGDMPWEFNFDHACAEYGGCIFRNVCMSEDEGPWLENYFQRLRWNPVTREEESW